MAEMSSLIVKFGSQGAQGLKDDLKDVNKEGKEAETSVQKFTKSLSGIAKAAAVAGPAGAAALLAITKSAATSAKEIENLSRLAGVNAVEFQKMAAAAVTVGVQQDKLADIMKDVQDKVGDFLQTGAGPMADFFENIAPKVGVTAKEFKNLSGPEALQKYVTSLEKANLSQSEMTFYMEAIASDATQLLPLMKDNGREMLEFANNVQKSGFYLTQWDIDSLSDLDTSFKQISGRIQTAANIVGAELSPFIQEIADYILDADVSMDDFRDSIKDAIRFAGGLVGFVADMGRGLQVAGKAGEALGVTIGTAFGVGVDKAKLFGLETQRVFVAAASYGEELAYDLQKSLAEAINEIIEIYNSLPFVDDITPITIPEPNIGPFTRKLKELDGEIELIQSGINVGWEQVGEAWAEVSDLMLKDLPSEEIKRRIEEIFTRAEESAKKASGVVSKAEKESSESAKKLGYTITSSYDSILDKIEATNRGQKIMFDDMAEKAQETAGSMRDSFSAAVSSISSELGEFGGLFNGLSSVAMNGFTANSSAQLGQGVGQALGTIGGGEYGSVGASLGAALGTALLPGIGTVIGAALGGLAGGFFGGGESDLTQSTTVDLATGRITSGGLTGDKFSRENRDAADSVGDAIASLISVIEEKTGNALDDVINLNVGSRDGFDLYINGKTIFEDRQGEITEVVEEIFEFMLEEAGLVSDVYKQLQRDNESIFDTMARVEMQFIAVNNVSEMLGMQFGALGDQGLIAADALIQATGGIQNFVQGANYFYNNFFTEQERFNDLTDNLTSSFADLNIAMPETREGFKDLVLGLDTTTESGADMYAALINLAPQMDTYLDKMEAQRTELEKQYITYDNLGSLLKNVNTDLATTLNILPRAIAATTSTLSLRGESNQLYDRFVPNLGMPGILGDVGTQLFSPTTSANDSGVSLRDSNQLYDRAVEVIEETAQAIEETTQATVDLIDYESMRADAIRDITKAYTDQESELSRFAETMGSLSQSLRAAADDLLIGDLSALSPQDQYSASRSMFNDIASRARLGDIDALQQLSSAGSTFLQESRQFQGSAGTYASDFDLVQNTLRAAADLTSRQQDNSERQLEQLRAQVSELVQVKEEVKTLQEAIAALTAINQAAAQQTLNEQRKTNETLDGLKSNSDLQVSAA